MTVVGSEFREEPKH